MDDHDQAQAIKFKVYQAKSSIAAQMDSNVGHDMGKTCL